MPVKLLLDTDIGTDIDDAICLAYLLAKALKNRDHEERFFQHYLSMFKDT